MRRWPRRRRSDGDALRCGHGDQDEALSAARTEPRGRRRRSAAVRAGHAGILTKAKGNGGTQTGKRRQGRARNIGRRGESRAMMIWAIAQVSVAAAAATAVGSWIGGERLSAYHPLLRWSVRAAIGFLILSYVLILL